MTALYDPRAQARRESRIMLNRVRTRAMSQHAVSHRQARSARRLPALKETAIFLVQQLNEITARFVRLDA
jgi:hypothetical protein